MVEDLRSKNFVFTSFCITCASFQANGIVKGKWRSSIVPVVQMLMEYDVNIIQLPCPEASFGGYRQGLSRKPQGLKKYSTLEYQSHCETISNDVIQKAVAMVERGFRIATVIGIENSPSCAVSYIYTNKGMSKRRGIFFEILHKRLLEENIDIPFVGVNRRNEERAIGQLKKILEERM